MTSGSAKNVQGQKEAMGTSAKALKVGILLLKREAVPSLAWRRVIEGGVTND